MTYRDKASVGQVHLDDCQHRMGLMPANSVHMILTDPPYAYEHMDDRWLKGQVKNEGLIRGLSSGMKLDPKQGYLLQRRLTSTATLMRRVLKPGGFLLMFAAPRMYHRAAMAVEHAGFEIRDMVAWNYTNKAQFKAFKIDHLVRMRNDIDDDRKREIIAAAGGRKTPQLRPLFQPLVLAQKPREGTFADNWMQHEVGLMDAEQSLDGKVPANVMTVNKEPNDYDHLTPKPVKLCEHLIRLFTKEGQTVLDPYLGSGTTGVAAIRAGRRCIGIEIDADVCDIAKERIVRATQSG